MLSPDTRIGPYQIIALLGMGGMGEVYRATDTHLKRHVAIKVLPVSVAADAERLRRFQREAEVLAALNHPHIAAIYGLERSDGTLALVMELVEGPTLADRLAQGAIRLADALPLARQIAEALEAAHEQGIIHRDLKPANIKVRADGTVKVLDFGLAKAMEPMGAVSASASMSPTLSMRATQAGIILGTAAYMSPEQARGQTVDKRADIWAFGAVLFEMLTGRQPFPGDDISHVLARVIERDPDWNALPASAPVALRQLLTRCLQKDPKRRMRDIGDALVQVDELLTGVPDASPATAPAQTAARAPRRVAPVTIASVLATALVATLATWILMRPAPTPARVERFVIPTPADASPASANQAAVAISPDGSRVVYRTTRGEQPTATNGVLYLRDRGQLEPAPLRGTEGAIGPFFSPDGEWIGFTNGTDNTLQRVSVLGGPTQVICALDGLLRGASWGPDNTIVFATTTSKGLQRVTATGETQMFTKVDGANGESDHLYPEVLPGGQGVLFTLWNGTPERSRIAVVSVSDGHVSTLVPGGTQPRFVPSGHVVFAVGGMVRAVRFDPARLVVFGNPVSVVTGVGMTANGAAHYALSSTGSLVYIPGPVGSTTTRPMLSLGFVDRTGAIELLKVPPGPYQLPRLSPDGKRIAFGSDDGNAAAIWIYDLSGASAMRRLTFDGQGHNRFPVWSADSQRVTYQSDRENDLGMFWQPADGSGTAERLATAEEGTAYIPEASSPDGTRLLYNATGKDALMALWMLTLKDKKTERVDSVVSPAPTLSGAVFAPDGKWVAYTARKASSPFTSVYVQPFPPTGAKYEIPLSRNEDSGFHPVWSPDGKALFFAPGPGTRLYRVSVSTQPTFSLGQAVLLAKPFSAFGAKDERPYDISRDGQRVLGLMDAAQAAQSAGPQPQRILVVTNWFEELKAMVPNK